jgi:hypothetical protein
MNKSDAEISRDNPLLGKTVFSKGIGWASLHKKQTIIFITIFLILLVMSSGCRKSSEQMRAEREARERTERERVLRAEHAKSTAEEKYRLGREKGLERKYKESIDLFEEAERLDNTIKLKTQLFRNLMGEDMLKVSADFMEDGEIDHAEKILEMLDSKKRFENDQQKAKAAKQRLEWFRAGYKKLAEANQYIASYKTSEAIVLLKELVKEYTKTALADKAAAALRKLGQ